MRLALASVVALFAACGPTDAGVDVASTRVQLALDFTANALLEVFVLDEAVGSCAALLEGEVDPADDGVALHAEERVPAARMNGGGSVALELEALPAERALSFFARAVEDGELLSQDCEGGVVIPADGHVEVELVVVAVP